MDIRAARTDGEFFGRQDEYFPTPLNGELVVLKRTTVGQLHIHIVSGEGWTALYNLDPRGGSEL
jgi:hypothetical protein